MIPFVHMGRASILGWAHFRGELFSTKLSAFRFQRPSQPAPDPLRWCRYQLQPDYHGWV